MPEHQHERIERLETRVDRIEDKVAADLSKIYTKLDEMSIVISKAAVRAAKAECPNPGACVQLSHDLSHTVKLLTAQTERVERLELKILDFDKARVEADKQNVLALHEIQKQFHKIERDKAWVLGAWTVMALIGGIVGTVLTITISHFIGKL